MIVSKCPGQDTRYWKAEDIHEQECPHCGEMIEFWKTDVRVRCANCKQRVTNPRFNLGCAQWCSSAEQCLGGAVKGESAGALRRALDGELLKLAGGQPLPVKEIKAKLDRAEAECIKQKTDPLTVLTAIAGLEARHLGLLVNVSALLNTLVEEHHFPAGAVKEAGKVIENVQSGEVAGEREKIAAAVH